MAPGVAYQGFIPTEAGLVLLFWLALPISSTDRMLRSFEDVPAADRVELSPGQVLIQEGEESDTVYILLEGALSVSRQVDDQTAVIALVDQPGSLVGEMVALGGGPRNATVTAQDSSRLVSIPVGDFCTMLLGDPGLSDDLVHAAVRRAEEGELAELLAEHFGIVDEGTLVATCGSASWRRLAQGETLFSEGVASDSVYFVVRGRLIASRNDPVSGNVKVGELGRGDVVGEIGLLGHTSRSATVTAVRDTVVAEMSEKVFLALIEGQPRMMIELYLDAMERARNPRWRSAPSTTVGLVAAESITMEPFVSAIVEELNRHGEVRRLSPSLVDAMLEVPGIAHSERGSVEEIRVGRLLHEAELDVDFLVIELGRDPGQWTRRGLGMVDHLLILVTPHIEQHDLARIEAILGACPTAVRRTAVVVHESRTTPSGSASLRHRLGADSVVHVQRPPSTDLARLARLSVGRPNTLVLSGGGGRGFAHIGVYRALVEIGFPVDLVGGTSIGGVLGAVIATGLTPDEITQWSESKFSDVLDYTLPLVSLTKGARIAQHAMETWGDRGIEDLWLTYFAMSTDLTTSRPHIHDSGRVTLAIRATCAIPGVMPPVPHGDALLIDGGVLNNLPIDVARSKAPRGLIVASDVAPPQGPGSHGDYGLSVSGWQALASKLRKDRSPYPDISAVLMRSMITASMRERDVQVHDGLADCYLDLDIRGVSMLDFDSAGEIARRGYEAAMPVLETWLASTAMA